MMLRCTLRSHPHFAAYCALASVCFFWGTTYVAIRMALESFPPLLLMGIRFSLSGLLVLLYALATGAPLPKGRELWLTAVYGIILIGGGTGGLVFAEQIVPSSLAAIFITLIPFWMVGLESLIPGGERLHAPTLVGMLAGFSGVVVLMASGGSGTLIAPNVARGFLILQAGCACWAFGSISIKRLKTAASPIVGGAIQQFATGLFFLLLAALFRSGPSVITSRGLGAIIYLVTFGSIVGYSSYVYALAKLPVAMVSAYTYVNPAVAAVLGWMIYDEHFGLREAFAMAVIFVGVALVKRSVGKKAEAERALGSE